MSQSVTRAARIIDAIAADPRTVAELAESFGLHRSTMFRELQSLEEVGWVRRRGSGRYALGTRLAALMDRSIVYVDKAEDEAGVRMYSRVGKAVIPYSSAVGKAILADLDPAGRDAVLGGAAWERHTEHTITTREALEILLKEETNGSGRGPGQRPQRDGHAADRQEEIAEPREQEAGQGRRRPGLRKEPCGGAEEGCGEDDQKVER